MKARTLLVKLFYKKYDGVLSVSKEKFRLLKDMKKECGPMFVKGLKNMIKKAEEAGPFKIKLLRGRKTISSTSIDDVAATLH